MSQSVAYVGPSVSFSIPRSNVEPARFHSAGSKSFLIASGSSCAPLVQPPLAYSAHCSIDWRISSETCAACPIASLGGASPRKANGGGLPSTHASNMLFWFSAQSFIHSLPCSNPFIAYLEQRALKPPINADER